MRSLAYESKIIPCYGRFAYDVTNGNYSLFRSPEPWRASQNGIGNTASITVNADKTVRLSGNDVTGRSMSLPYFTKYTTFNNVVIDVKINKFGSTGVSFFAAFVNLNKDLSVHSIHQVTTNANGISNLAQSIPLTKGDYVYQTCRLVIGLDSNSYADISYAKFCLS